MYKSQLQELCHKRRWSMPEYEMARVGPDHNPRFSSKVTINGVCFQTPQNHCRSSKEAQNMAAQLAFDNLTTVETPAKGANSANNAYGASSSSIPTDVNQESPFGSKDDTGPKEILHTFKNRLQHYAQKYNFPLPAYYSEFEGPPHARRFKAKVTISGTTYESSEFFPTLKEAEHSAAKVAFETLSRDDIQEDERLYKTLLQEFAQKKGLLFPKYSTTKSGPSHHPIFLSTVEIGTSVFQGSEANTKKQAEMFAAKVAFNSLLKHKEEQAPSRYHIMGTSGVTSFNLQSTINKALDGSVQAIALNPPDIGEPAVKKECILKEALTMSTSSTHIVTDGQHGLGPKVERTSVEERNADQDEMITKNLSSNSDLNAQLQDPLPPTSSPSSATVKIHAKRVGSDTEHHKLAEAVKRPSRNFVVFPKDYERAIPEGSSIMAYSDDQYVAMKLNDELL